MKRTYVWIDGELVERKRDATNALHYVVPDIQPYKSMIDGSMITSRSKHRAHLAEHNCIEIGNEDPTKHVRPAHARNTRLERIKHLVNTRMTNAEADRILQALRSRT